MPIFVRQLLGNEITDVMLDFKEDWPVVKAKALAGAALITDAQKKARVLAALDKFDRAYNALQFLNLS